MVSRIGSSELIYKQENQKGANGNQLNIGDSALKLLNNTPIQQVMDSAGKSASKIIQTGGDLLAAPGVWVKDMQKNWLLYMVLAAIILSSITILYCVVNSYFYRKKSPRYDNNFIEMFKVLSNQVAPNNQHDSSFMEMFKILSNQVLNNQAVQNHQAVPNNQAGNPQQVIPLSVLGVPNIP